MSKKKIREILKKIFFFPVSPKIFVAGIGLLRSAKALKRPCAGQIASPKRILISHPYASVGDVVLVLPLIDVIHRYWPDALIDIVVGANTAEFFTGHRQVNQVFRYRPTQSPLLLVRVYLRVLQALMLYRREMMQTNYDLAVAPRWDSDPDSLLARYVAYLTGAPWRCAYSGGIDGGDKTVDDLLTHVAHGGESEHEVLRYTRLIDRAGLATFTMEERNFVEAPIERLVEVAKVNDTIELRKLIAESIPSTFKNYAIISPGATNSRRIWPADKLSQLLAMLNSRYGLSFLIVGSLADALSCERLAQSAPAYAVSLAGKTNTSQLTAIIYNSVLFVGNDSGPGHIAGALGVPTLIVSPFPLSCSLDHPNAPARFRPCGPRVKVVQPPSPLPPCNPYCNLDEAHCITQVSVNDMFDAANSLLRGAVGNRWSRINMRSLANP
jgi:ADP-heptose:LPS heptosyltransferase